VVDEVVDEDAAITPQANRLPDSAVGAVLPRLSAVWWMISAVPELFLRSAEVNALLVVTSFAEPSERTCKAVRSPFGGRWAVSVLRPSGGWCDRARCRP
jgi:hypothetical protein